MHHELLSVTYGILIILFFSVDDMSAPFEGQQFAWRVYMTLIGAMMMYEMIRSHYEWDDTFMYMCMQWSTYLMCGGTRYPYWMVAYGAYIGVHKVMRDAESRIAEMDEQVMSNGFHIINVHNLTAEPMRMAIPDEEQSKENKTLREFRVLRKNREYAVGLSKHESILWRLSDNTGLLYRRETRRWIIFMHVLSMAALYAWWWSTLTWYTIFDVCMLFALLINDCTMMFITYHVFFILALVYARHKEFNTYLRA
tara:strand:- start:3673 stop:4431 length:759 start_codon:yes stop_codon:yes gene_type:complete